MKLRSYAKINLTLDITAKRDDGYHELNTVYQQVDLCDEIEIEQSESGSTEIRCSDPSLENDDNICVRAAQLMKERYDINGGVKITLQKKIPMGAGLGGGSGNAAAVIKGMNLIYRLNLDLDEMAGIGRELGMDVPFYIFGGTCLGTGRGDIIERLPDLPKRHVVIVYPDIHVSTGKAYGNLDYDKIGLVRASEQFIREYDFSLLHNDFEYSVLRSFPELAVIKNRLGPRAILSGSGSSLFGIYESEENARKHYDSLKKDFNRVFLNETVNRRVLRAGEIGFCYGVKRAVKGVPESTVPGTVQVLGNLVHNRQVIDGFREKGIRFISDIREVVNGTVVISAHGTSDSVKDSLRQKNITLVDLTCPSVKRVHTLTKEKEKQGRLIVLLGDKDHDEVRGIAGNLENVRVIREISGLTEEDLKAPITIAAQTTLDRETFRLACDELKKRCPDLEIIDSICAATKKRQESAEKLARLSDFMIVIGGRNSANTRRLVEICSRYCETRHIETGEEIDPAWFYRAGAIGITAGASTPDSVINSVEHVLDSAL